jgi:hypothetical protein
MSKADQRKKKRISMVATAVVRQSPSGSPIEAYVINISYGGIGISFEGLNPKDHGRLLSYLDQHIK